VYLKKQLNRGNIPAFACSDKGKQRKKVVMVAGASGRYWNPAPSLAVVSLRYAISTSV